MAIHDLFSQFIKDDNLVAVERFLEMGRDPNQPLENGQSPVVYAEIHGAEDCYYALLEFGASPTEDHLKDHQIRNSISKKIYQ